MRYPGRSKPKAGLEFYARLFPKRIAGTLETPPAKTNATQYSPNHSTQLGSWGGFASHFLPDPLVYYLQELPSLKGQGEWRQAVCCFHADRIPSLSVNIETGGYYCHACQAKGGDVLAFQMQRYGMSFKEAAKQLGAWIG